MPYIPNRYEPSKDHLDRQDKKTYHKERSILVSLPMGPLEIAEGLVKDNPSLIIIPRNKEE